MRIFLDTEFTDFINPQLISFGLVAETGQEFYAELADGWRIEQCSTFVVDVVLPRLDQLPSTTLNRVDASMRLVYWLSRMGDKLTVVSDAPVDWILISGLLQRPNHRKVSINHQPLMWPGAAMARHYQLLLNQALEGEVKRHNALVDARALRHAVMQTESDFRK